MTYKDLAHTTYATEAATTDRSYMARLKDRLAEETVRAFADFLRENPEVVQVESVYDIARQATCINSRIRVVEWEK